jgi:hypothetical protein
MADDLNDRLSRRFDEEDKDDEEDEEQNGQKSQTSEKNMSSSTSQKAQNIKKEWNVSSFYLPDDLNRELTTAYKRLNLEIEQADAEIDLKKTRHYYPLVVALGLERLEEMEVTEVTEQLESQDFL